MKILAIAILFLTLPIIGAAQAPARFDMPILPTTPATTPIGTMPPVLAVINATVAVCGYPATIVGGMCTNTITTYTDSTLSTACPPTAQLTQQGSNACVSTTGLQGGFGFWYDASIQTHFTYTVKTKWGTFGPYDIAQASATGSVMPSTSALPLGGYPTASATVGPTKVYTDSAKQSVIQKTLPVDVRHPDFSSGSYITSVTLSGGTGCSNSGNVTFSAPNLSPGIQATGTVVGSGGVPSYIRVTNGGGGYSSATVTVPGCSVQPTATVHLAQGCGSAADPTGVTDSTCAIQEAINSAASTYVAGTPPFPSITLHGTYLVGTYQSVRMPCFMHMIADGNNSTTLNVVAGRNNGLTVFNNFPFGAVPWSCSGSLDNIGIKGTGKTHLGNLLELDGTIGFTIKNFRGENTAGRCVEITGGTERTHWVGTTYLNACRLSFANDAEGDKTAIDHLLVDAAGQTDDGYNYNINSVVSFLQAALSRPTITARYVLEGQLLI